MKSMIKQITIASLLCFYSSGYANEENTIIVQSTTSTQNSGLYDYILPKFKELSGIQVNVVAVGTGQALKNAQNGDGDVVLVHAKESEETFIAQGYGVERFDLMYNDFVIVGPESDPANIRGSKNIIDSLRKIVDTKSTFASRGDDSGTHKKELSLWKKLYVNTDDHLKDWYRETGAGMGATLNTATGMKAYVLTDRATWISFANKQDYTIHVQGDELLFNQYGVMMINPERHPHVKVQAAQTFIDWLLSLEGQDVIRSYRLDGQQLFFPNARPMQLKKAG